MGEKSVDLSRENGREFTERTRVERMLWRESVTRQRCSYQLLGQIRSYTGSLDNREPSAGMAEEVLEGELVLVGWWL